MDESLACFAVSCLLVYTTGVEESLMDGLDQYVSIV